MGIEAFFLANLPILDRAVDESARRYGLTSEDAEDLNSFVRLRLIEDDYRVLRNYSGESTIESYLVVVVERVALDYVTHRHGESRPSGSGYCGHGARSVSALEELALDEAAQEFPELERHIYFFKRPDLCFYGVSLENERMRVFEVMILNKQATVSADHIDAVSTRFHALAGEVESRRQEIGEGDLELIFLLVTDLSGDSYLEFERETRMLFARRAGEDVRIYQERVLLDNQRKGVYIYARLAKHFAE
jgi:DNA-directed RNA polymerase specialized sigma24 family protein